MKKIILSVALLALSTSNYAQNLEKSYFGVKLGFNNSSVVSDEGIYADLDISRKIGFAGGIYYNYGFSDTFSIQTEVLWSSMGANVQTKDPSDLYTKYGNVDQDLNLDYISVPILFKYSPMSKLGIFVGPELDFLVNASDLGEIDVYNSYFDSFDFAATVGLEFWFTKNIGIYGRYTRGFIDIDDFNEGDNNIFNEAIQFGITLTNRKSIAPPPPPPPAKPAPVAAAPKPVVKPAPVPVDTDGDGVNDEIDRCPKMAGLADNYGCPDLTIYYKRDVSSLDPDDKTQLDKVVTFLNTYPDLNIELEGYTSATGTDAYNLTLSDKRANQAKDYIVSKGISSSRIVSAKGFGKTNLIGDQNTDEGRAQSRRTVVKIAK